VVSSSWVKVWVTPFPIPIFGVKNGHYLLFNIEETIPHFRSIKTISKG
jgi:hypothetical protein